MKKTRPIPAEIDPLKLAKDSIGQKKRENRNRIAKLKRDTAKAEEELAKAEAAEKVIKGEQGLITQDAIDDLPPNVQAHLNSDDVIFRPNPGPQTEFLSSTEDQVFYGGARGGGKAGHVDIPVPVPLWVSNTGWKRLGDIEVGDQVFSPSGEPVDVIWTSGTFVPDKAYEVTFNTGEKFVVDARHQWHTMTAIERKQAVTRTEDYRAKRQATRKSVAKTLSKKPWVSKSITAINQFRVHEYKKPPTGSSRTTEEIANSMMWGKEVNHSVATCTSIDLPDADLPIDPYLFGLWLGDGYSSQFTIGMLTEDMEAILPHVQEPASKTILQREGQREMLRCRWPLLPVLRANNLYKNKHIPAVYLRASRAQRIALLQGMLDTDGSCAAKVGDIELGFSNKRLLEDAAELVSSLGIKTTVLTKRAICSGRDVGETYRMTFMAPFPAFKLPRKLARQKMEGFRPTVNRRYITSVTECMPTSVCCIQVANPDGLYVWGKSFITTHNSYALLVDPLYHCDKKHHRALIIRRTMPELRDLIAKSQILYKSAYPGAKWREQEKEWRFPSGARIEFGYAENMLDALRYQGQSFSGIYIDEIPQYATPDILNFLTSSLRSVDPRIKPVLRATGNPGNIGSNWVKEMFIDPAPPNTRFEVPIKVTTPKGVIESVISRKYIPATVFDNPYLTYDNSYITMLASLPEMQRRQFLEGDWTAFDGAAFSDFRVDTHVYDPDTFEIPPGWMRFRAADWGFTQPACCLWFAVDYDNNLYVYRELYVKGKNAEEFARLVIDLEYNEPIRYGVLDSSVWARRGDTGPSIAETMIRAGCKWRPADRSPGSRKARKMELHRRLALKPTADGTMAPSIFISKHCRNLIRTLPLLPIDPNDPEDVDTKADDHAYDGLTYGIMSRPISQETPFDLNNLNRTNDFQMADRVFGY